MKLYRLFLPIIFYALVSYLYLNKVHFPRPEPVLGYMVGQYFSTFVYLCIFFLFFLPQTPRNLNGVSFNFSWTVPLWMFSNLNEIIAHL